MHNHDMYSWDRESGLVTCRCGATCTLDFERNIKTPWEEFVERDCYPDGTKFHKFSDSEKFDYDRLSAAGRSHYDSLRWSGTNHRGAFMDAVQRFSFKKQYLIYGEV